MSKLNERLQLLEQLQRNDEAADRELSRLPPERLAAVLQEGIMAMERDSAEGHDDALPKLREALADLEGHHGYASH